MAGVDKPTNLHAALVAAQAEMPALQRDKINPHFKSKYLSLESLLAEVLPVLNGHGLALVQAPTFVETETGIEPALRTILVHGPSGETLEETMLLLLAKRDPQGQGSGITYAKRYALMALCGLSADEDDDGNAATTRSGQRRTGGRGSTGGAAVITAAQRNELFAKVRDLHISTSRAQAIIRAAAGTSESEKIPAAKFAAVMEALDAATEAKAA